MVQQHYDLLEQQADIIVVDPPRKGLDPAVVQALQNIAASSPTNARKRRRTTSSSSSNMTTRTDCPEPRRPRLLVYVSCGFTALQRDLAQLCQSPAEKLWKVQDSEGHVLFPGSDAIESLVFLVTSDQ